jgi:hypothetical protein
MKPDAQNPKLHGGPIFEFLATATEEEIWEAYPWVKG